jgi:hypothetical protein
MQERCPWWGHMESNHVFACRVLTSGRASENVGAATVRRDGDWFSALPDER